MRFQIRTDNHIDNTEELAAWIQAEIESAVTPRFADRLQRVEVYLQDLNAHKGGLDKRCLIETHLSGHQPVVVSNDAAGIHEAVSGAAEKLTHALAHTLGRLDDRPGRMSMSGEPT
jgi:hypothetical protein